MRYPIPRPTCRSTRRSPPRCSPTAPFTSTALVDELSSSEREEEVTLSSDELELYLTRLPATGGSEILRSQRASITSAWSTPTVVAALSGNPLERATSLAPDGLTLYMSVDLGASEQLAIATRTSTALDFGPPSQLAGLNTASAELWAMTDPDELGIHFASNREVGPLRLYRATRSSVGAAFDSPSVVEVPSEPYLPVIVDGGLGLYHSNLAIGPLYSSRASIAEPFSDGVAIEGAPGGWLSWISADLCRAYYAVGLPGGPGDIDIHLATREPE